MTSFSIFFAVCVSFFIVGIRWTAKGRTSLCGETMFLYRACEVKHFESWILNYTCSRRSGRTERSAKHHPTQPQETAVHFPPPYRQSTVLFFVCFFLNHDHSCPLTGTKQQFSPKPRLFPTDWVVLWPEKDWRSFVTVTQVTQWCHQITKCLYVSFGRAFCFIWRPCRATFTQSLWVILWFCDSPPFHRHSCGQMNQTPLSCNSVPKYICQVLP